MSITQRTYKQRPIHIFLDHQGNAWLRFKEIYEFLDSYSDNVEWYKLPTDDIVVPWRETELFIRGISWKNEEFDKWINDEIFPSIHDHYKSIVESNMNEYINFIVNQISQK